MAPHDNGAEQFSLFDVGADTESDPTPATDQPQLSTPDTDTSVDVDTTGDSTEIAESDGEDVGKEPSQVLRPWESLPITGDADGHALIVTAEAPTHPRGTG